jgi:hypothetical protein
MSEPNMKRIFRRLKKLAQVIWKKHLIRAIA